MIENQKVESKDVYKTTLYRRSIRRFKQKKVPFNILKKCVNAARLAPSAANLQPLEFIIVDNEELCSEIFKTLGFAGYLSHWNPDETEKPMAYIVILCNDPKNKWYKRDASFAAANIMITAESYNIGSCIFCNIKRDKIRNLLEIPEKLIIDSVVALGYKKENPKAVAYTGSIKYYHDENRVLHVPKRSLEKIMHINSY